MTREISHAMTAQDCLVALMVAISVSDETIRTCVSVPLHRRKVLDVWKLGAEKEGMNKSQYALKCIYETTFNKGHITAKQLVEMM